MGSIKEDTARGVKWSFVERVAVQGIQFVLGFILARLLTPSDYGIVGMMSIFIAVSENIIDSGFSKALIRKLDRTETDFSTAFYFNIVVGLVCYGALFAASPLIASFFNTPVLEDLAKVMALCLFVNSLSVVQVAKLTVAVDFKSQAKASAAAAFISGIVGVGLAYAGFGVWALAWQSVAKSVINTVVIWRVAGWRPSARFSWTSFRNLFGYGSKLLTASIINTIHGQLTTLAIGKWYTPADLGNYTRGQQFATLPNFQIVSVLQRVTFPILARLQDDRPALIGAYRKYIRTSSLAIMFLTVILAALARPVIILLLGDKWVGAIPFLQVFAFGIMFDHVNQINMNLLQISGRTDVFLRTEVIKKIISFGMLAAAIPFGVMAICVSRVLYAQVAVAINTNVTGRYYGLGYREQLADILPYLGISLICCAPAYAMTLLCDIWILDIMVGGIVAVALLLAILKMKGDSVYMEFIEPHVKKILHRK